jgi:hypothetical protein
MEKLYLLLIILLVIISLIWQTNEKFSLTSNENKKLKNLFENGITELQYENNIKFILISFDLTQKKFETRIAERLPAFKSEINSIINNDNLVDNLYFDLRMNENNRDKIILGYLYLNDLNKTKKLGDIDLDNTKLDELVTIAKQWAKK